MLVGYINITMKMMPLYLVVAMFATMLVLYILYPQPEVIIRYPQPTQDVSDVYVDDNNVCYRYYRKEIPQNTDMTGKN
jgi:hypothetical protein